MYSVPNGCWQIPGPDNPVHGDEVPLQHCATPTAAAAAVFHGQQSAARATAAISLLPPPPRSSSTVFISMLSVSVAGCAACHGFGALQHLSLRHAVGICCWPLLPALQAPAGAPPDPGSQRLPSAVGPQQQDQAAASAASCCCIMGPSSVYLQQQPSWWTGTAQDSPIHPQASASSSSSSSS